MIVVVSHQHLTETDADMIDEALAAVIESASYPNLRAMFLNDLENLSALASRRESPRDRTKLWFQKATEAGLEHDVYVHTRSRIARRRREYDLPVGYSELDLRTSPYADSPLREAVSQYALKPDWGVSFWRSFCRKCGKCDYCYSLYSKEVWRQRKTGSNRQPRLNV